MKKLVWMGICALLIQSVVALSAAHAVDLERNTTIPSNKTDKTSESAQADTAESAELNASAQYFIDQGLIETDAYQPDRFLTRIVAARMIADITGLSEEAARSSYTHPFVDLSAETERLIGFLYHFDIIDGMTSNRFREDDVCDADTFLMFLLRAMNYALGGETAFEGENARALAKESGILPDGFADDKLELSVNEAFDICYNALFAQPGAGAETLLDHLTGSGVIAPSAAQAEPSAAYEITWPDIEPFFREDFENSTLTEKRIVYKTGETRWYGGIGHGVQNSITDTGYLELSGQEQELAVNQQVALLKRYLQGNESYGMTFTVNVQKISNEGDESRVIFRVIPRTLDKDFTKYYAVNYYAVQTLGSFSSNLIQCRWSITNTNAPSGTAPLAEASFLLKENVDYTARLLIEDLEDGSVHIAFYIDGADRYSANTAPLMEYTDTTSYRITQSAMGPAFGISGHIGVSWGFSSSVRFDDVALYDVESFAALNKRLESAAATAVLLDDGYEYADEVRYLINRGVLMPEQRRFDQSAVVSVEEFLAMALYFNGEHMREGETAEQFVAEAYASVFRGTGERRNTDYKRSITRYEAALILQKLLPGEPGTDAYWSLYADRLDSDYRSAAYFAVQNSYLLLDGENRFNGAQTITRGELLRIFALAANAQLRTHNCELTFPSVYSDYAVLQGGKPIVVTGKGMSGDTVTVSLGSLRGSAKVVDGAWSIALEAQPYGGPYTLEISDSAYTYQFKGVYIGEVVVVAGQSNAEMSIGETDHAAEILRTYGGRDTIRVFHPDSIAAVEPRYLLPNAWSAIKDTDSAYIIRDTSAIGVYYVDQLRQLNPALADVKFGIIQLTYGGTSIEMFLPNSVSEKNGFVQQDGDIVQSAFWNGYMAGATPYSASVLLYYQGENSTHLRYMYEPLLRDYIWGVRQAFCDASLPVLLVQISGYGDNLGQDGDSWPYIREVQMRVANTTENVGLVTSIDLADDNPQEIHPTQKQPIGQRLAYLAMELVYGQQNDMQSASLTGYARNGSVYTLRFDTGALTLNEAAKGSCDFEVLRADGTWVDAQARVEGDTLLVWNDAVIVPQGVRYAWSNYPKASLYGQNGLPVLPFNTTKDLLTPADESTMTTNAGMLKKAYHLLETGDAVVNHTRGDAIRHVQQINAYLVAYTDGDIPGQAPGDELSLLRKQKDGLLAEDGTDETTVKAASHGLKADDWLYNAKYDAMTQVLEVIDADTVRVGRVSGQSSGNLFVVYTCIANVTAQE